MADYLTSLIARTREPSADVRPRRPSLFEPVSQWNFANDTALGLQPITELSMENETTAPAHPNWRPQPPAPHSQNFRPLELQPSDAPQTTEAPRRLEVRDSPSGSRIADSIKAAPRNAPRLIEARETDVTGRVELPPVIEKSEAEPDQSAGEPAPVPPVTRKPRRPQVVFQPPPIEPAEINNEIAAPEIRESQEITIEKQTIRKIKQKVVQESVSLIEEFEPEEARGERRAQIQPRIRDPEIPVPRPPETPKPHITSALAADTRVADRRPTSDTVGIIKARRPTPREPAPSVAAEQVINVTIGRVEVRAVSPPASQPAPDRRQAAKLMTLDDYLRQRAQGGRR